MKLKHSNKTTVLHVCHSERSEESRFWGRMETLRFTQGDLREVLLECLKVFADGAAVLSLRRQLPQAIKQRVMGAFTLRKLSD